MILTNTIRLQKTENVTIIQDLINTCKHCMDGLFHQFLHPHGALGQRFDYCPNEIIEGHVTVSRAGNMLTLAVCILFPSGFLNYYSVPITIAITITSYI